MQLGQRAGKAGALLFTRKVWAGILNLFVISYLARQLSKEDFGLVSVAGVFINIMDIFWQSIGDYLIYKKGTEGDQLINSAFWLNFLIIVCIVGLFFVSAPYIADYYHNDTIKYVIYLLVIGSLGGIFSNIPQAILKRNFDFAPIVISQTITGTLSQLSQLGMAIMGFGVYSLVIPSAIFPVIGGVYLFVMARPKLKANFETKHWGEIVTYTRFVIGNKVLGRFSSDGDSLIIGKVLGLRSLGVYNLANKFASFLNQNLMPIFDDVGLPVFTRYNHSQMIVRKQFLYTTRLLSLFLIPLYLLLVLFAPVIIGTLFTDKWYDAVFPLRILCIFSLIESITYSTGTLYNAMGQPKAKFRFAFIFTPIFLIVVWIFARQGLIIACITVTVLRTINFVYHIYRAGKIINLSVFSFFKEIQHVVIPNAILGLVYLGIIYNIHNINVKYLMMIMYIPAMYFISYRLYKKDMLKDYLLVCKVFPAFKMH